MIAALMVAPGCDLQQSSESVRAPGARPDTAIYYAATQRLPVCDVVEVDTTGWQAIGASAFRLQIPAGYQRREARGIDSEVGVWQHGRSVIGYDFGPYSDDLTYLLSPARELRMCHFRTLKHAVRIAFYRDEENRYWAAAHVANADKQASLTIHFVGDDRIVQDQALAAFRSLVVNVD